jgi:signal recognition particle subunit SRP54
MFEQISEKFSVLLRKIKGQHKISEANIEESLKEIRRNLLEADVHFKVVKAFLDRVKAKALGQEVLQSLKPGEQFVKIIFDELKQTLGGDAVDINCRENPSVILMVGLQGVGKTTTTAKLALFIRKKLGKKVALVSVDSYRPAAIEQLQTLGRANQIPVFPTDSAKPASLTVKEALHWATYTEQAEVLIIDSAGRLQIDQPMMAELKQIKEVTPPQEVLLVADAMLGQQSVQVAEAFHRELGLTGLVLTKVDGDARGGAALSIREVTGVPIKFLGTGEKVGALEVFHPDRLAGRILDMGDVLSLVERAQEVISQEQAAAATQKLMANEMSLEDFLQQIQMLKKMGGIASMLKMLPGFSQMQKQMEGLAPPEDEMRKIEAIIRSMTPKERRNPKILNASRRERIAKGSGTQVSDINKLIKQFEQAKRIMSQMMRMGGRGLGFLTGSRGGGLNLK